MADTGEMMARRPYKSGSLYQRTSDWRWVGTVESGYTESGARKRVTVSAAGCEGGCKDRCAHVGAIKRKLRDKQSAVRADGNQPTKRTVTVAKWAETWLEEIQTLVSPSAYTTDKAAMRRVVATIGAVKLADLTPEHVKKVAKKIRADGKSTSTALRYQGSLMRMLKAAALEGYSIAPNVLLAKMPKKAVNTRKAIPLPQTISLLEHVAGLPAGSRWALAFLQGHRQAESLGLTWPQIDLEAETLTISWQLKALRYVDRDDPSKGFLMPDGYEARHLTGAYHLVRPKSAAGWRVQPLVTWAVSSLRAWREIAPDDPNELVWPGARRGWPRNPANDRAEFAAIQRAVKVKHPDGRPYVPHEIRHGTATLLMELGVPESVRIAIMGHSSIAVTHGYEHVDLAQSRLALERAAERLQLG